jgi:hypothetical protein
MEISDGRTFNIAKAFCVGWGGTQWCMWSSNYFYRVHGAFTAYARSYDGVVRQFDLYTVSKTGYRAENIRALAVGVTPERFNAVVQSYASALARLEQQKGCAKYSP